MLGSSEQTRVIHIPMFKTSLCSLLIVFLLSVVSSSFGQVKVLSFEEFERQHLNAEGDTLFVINFWATWCRPCVAELPYFLEAEEEFSSDEFKLLLVSLDFKTDLDLKVKPFLEKKGIGSEVVLLDDLDYNSWIDKVSEEWSGAIPATLFLNPEKGIYIFKEGEYEKEILLNQIRQLL